MIKIVSNIWYNIYSGKHYATIAYKVVDIKLKVKYLANQFYIYNMR